MIEVLNAPRLTKLKCLLAAISEAIDKKPGARDLAQLAKQYRETSREIEELEHANDTEQDEIGQLLARREQEGRANPVRAARRSYHDY